MEISADGRFLVFSSRQIDLTTVVPTPYDSQNNYQIYFYDRLFDTLQAISIDVGNDTLGGNADSFEPTVSDDGCYISFHSFATNLASIPLLGGTARIFLVDRCDPLYPVTLVSDSSADGDSLRPRISDDGTVIAFESVATNLVAGDTNAASDIFVYNITSSGPIVRVSLTTGSGELDDASTHVSITSDGSSVAFLSVATNLPTTGGNPSALASVAIRSIASMVTTRVPSDGDCAQPFINGAGSHAVFACDAGNLTVGDSMLGYNKIYRLDIGSSLIDIASLELCNDTLLANAGAAYPKISDDGNLVFFHTAASNLLDFTYEVSDTNSANDVYVRDFTSGTTSLVSQIYTFNEAGNADSWYATISSDGQTIAYVSDATNMVPSDANAVADAFFVTLVNVQLPACYCDNQPLDLTNCTYTCTDDMLCAPWENSGICVNATMMDCMACTVDGKCDAVESETCADCNNTVCVPDGFCGFDENWHNCPDDCITCSVDMDCENITLSTACGVAMCMGKICREFSDDTACTLLFPGELQCLTNATCDIFNVTGMADDNYCVYEIGLGDPCDDGISCTLDICNATGICVPDVYNHTACDDGFTCTDDLCTPGTMGADLLTGCLSTQNETVCDALPIPDACTAGYTCNETALGHDPVTGCVEDFAPINTPCDVDSYACTYMLCDGAGNCDTGYNDTVCELLNPGFDAVCVNETCVGAGGDANGCLYPFWDANPCNTYTCIMNETCLSGFCQGGTYDDSFCGMTGNATSPCVDSLCQGMGGDAITGCNYTSNTGEFNMMCDDMMFMTMVGEDEYCPDCNATCVDDGVCDQNENSIICSAATNGDCQNCNDDNICDQDESDNCGTVPDCNEEPCNLIVVGNGTAADGCCDNRENNHNCWQDCDPCVDNGICEAFENAGCADCLGASDCMIMGGLCNCGGVNGQEGCCEQDEQPCICAIQSCSFDCDLDGMCDPMEMETCADCLSVRCTPDGKCNINENAHNCPEDCQATDMFMVVHPCGCNDDTVCDPGELNHCDDCNPERCVPDGKCMDDENAHNCPEDCLAKMCNVTIDCLPFDSATDCCDLDCVQGFCRPVFFTPELTACNIYGGALCTPGYCDGIGFCQTIFNDTLCSLDLCQSGICDPDAIGADPVTGCTAPLADGEVCYPTLPVCYANATCLNGTCVPQGPFNDTLCLSDPADSCRLDGTCVATDGGHYLEVLNFVNCNTFGTRTVQHYLHNLAVQSTAVAGFLIMADNTFVSSVDDEPGKNIALVAFKQELYSPEAFGFDHLIFRDFEPDPEPCLDLASTITSDSKVWVACGRRFSSQLWNVEFYLLNGTSVFEYSHVVTQTLPVGDDCGVPNYMTMVEDLLVLGVHINCAAAYEAPNLATCTEVTSLRYNTTSMEWYLASSFDRTQCTGLSVDTTPAPATWVNVAIVNDLLVWVRAYASNPPPRAGLTRTTEAFVFRLETNNTVTLVQVIEDPTPDTATNSLVFGKMSCGHGATNTLALFDKSPPHPGNHVCSPLIFVWNGTQFEYQYAVYPVVPVSPLFPPDPLTAVMYPEVVSCSMNGQNLLVGRDTHQASFNERFFASLYKRALPGSGEFNWIADLNYITGGSEFVAEGNDVGFAVTFDSNLAFIGSPYSASNSDLSGILIVCLDSETGCTTGCEIPDAPNGTPCDDGIACTEVDSCIDGHCYGNESNDTVCGAATDQCSPHVCDTCFGCVVDVIPDGNTCETDTYSCTIDQCTNGTCIFFNTTGECAAMNTECVTYECDVDHLMPAGIDLVTGCYPTLLNGTMCGANGTCIAEGECINGTCTGVLSPAGTPCPESVPCVISAVCDAMGGCTNYTVNATFCPDTVPTELAQCVNRTCDPDVFGADANGCVDDILTGMGCNDTFLCTEVDECQMDGTCAGTANDTICAPFLDPMLDPQCMVVVCEPDGSLGVPDANGCVFLPASLGTPCDVATCVTGAVCDGAGLCTIVPAFLDDDYCASLYPPEVGEACKNSTCSPLDAEANPVTGCINNLQPVNTTCDLLYPQTCVVEALCNATGVCEITMTNEPLCNSTFETESNCVMSTCDPDAVGSDPLTGCLNTNTTNGEPCDDSYACTFVDMCDGMQQCITTENNATCAGYPPAFGSQGCVAGYCDTTNALGLGSPDINGCVFQNVTDATPCTSDGYTCTLDVCDGIGTCLHIPDNATCIASPQNTPCVTPVCVGSGGDPITGCIFVPVPDDFIECDGFNCTVGDQCVSGACIPGSNTATNNLFCQTEVVVTECESVVCSPYVGAPDAQGCLIVDLPGPNVFSCNDSLTCTMPDTCDGSGGCFGYVNNTFCEVKADAMVSDPVCIIGECVLSGGDADGCNITFTTEPCDDGYDCTDNDVCSGGVCMGTPNNATCGAEAALLGGCYNAYCEPANINATASGCVFYNVTSGPCVDPYECTLDDLCSLGDCFGTPNDTVCDMTEPALSNQCVAGNCTADPGTSPSGCIFYNLTGDACDDGLLCTIVDQCDGLGGCVGTVLDNDTCNGIAPALDDQCVIGVCDPSNPDYTILTGCVFYNKFFLPDPSCNDTFSCTETDECQEDGGCIGTEVDDNCDAFKPTGPGIDPVCIDALCDPYGGGEAVTGCRFENNTVDCDDNILCTIDDRCDGAAGCVGTPTDSICAAQPEAALLCTLAICDPTNSSGLVLNSTIGCYYENMTIGENCTDAYTCTLLDVCDGGNTCAGTPDNATCDGIEPALSDQCISGLCAATGGTEPSGCTFYNNTLPCDDGLACTYNMTCNGAGICVANNFNDTFCQLKAESLATHPDCAMGICVGVLGDSDGCTIAFPSGTSCTDGFDCTNDTCDGLGNCNSTEIVGYCDTLEPALSDQCISGYCEPNYFVPNVPTGCVFRFDLPSVSCDDGYPCTYLDHCDGLGGCTGTNNHTLCMDNVMDECILGQCDTESVSPLPDVDGCVYTVQDSGELCDDMVECTDPDNCNMDGCVGTPDPSYCAIFVVPPLELQCAILTCNASALGANTTSGCLVEVDDGANCTDSYTCTTSEVCDVSGVCTPGTYNNATCDALAPALGNPCIVGVCVGDGGDPVTGCIFVNVDVACDDGYDCSVNDTCVSGECVGSYGAAEDDYCNSIPPFSENECVAAICSPPGIDDGSGCDYVYLDDSFTCDDDVFCTFNTTCDGNGVCSGGYLSNSTCESLALSLGQCYTGYCDPNGVGVDPTSGCVFSFTQDNRPCTDLINCTLGDVCLSNGTCAGQPEDAVCSGFHMDEGQCANYQCDPFQFLGMGPPDANGCVSTNETTGANCTDPYICTIVDVCLDETTCEGTPDDSVCNNLPPALGNQCVIGNCTTAPGTDPYGCEFFNLTSACDDGFSCTTGEVCSDGECGGGTPDNATCNALAPALGDQCVIGICDPSHPSAGIATGCYFVNIVVPCTDGFLCTAPDMCDAEGDCTGPVNDTVCEELKPSGPGIDPVCIEAECNPSAIGHTAEGCLFTNVTTDCDDNILCTVDDACDGAGGCSGVATDSVCAMQPEAMATCTLAICDPTNSSGLVQDMSIGCYYENVTMGENCTDVYTCTLLDVCDGGDTCAGTPDNTTCEDIIPAVNNTCVTGYCAATGGSEPSGCLFFNNTLGCVDPWACTTGDVCLDGVCEGTPDNSTCVPPGDCYEGICDPHGLLGTPDAAGCVFLPKAVNASCSDGIPCTTDLCDGAGTCNSFTGPAEDAYCDGSLVLTDCQRGICTVGVGCEVDPLPIGTPCVVYGALCTNETCDGTGDCVVDYDNTVCPQFATTDLQCTLSFCFPPASPNATTGCLFFGNTGAVCSDGYDCTPTDQCVGFVCTGTIDTNYCPNIAAVVNDDCVTATCIPDGVGPYLEDACVSMNEPNGTFCDDGFNCTTDYCNGAGTCVGHTNTVEAQTFCDDQIMPGECSLAECDPLAVGHNADGCVEIAITSGPCDDGLDCTYLDMCNGSSVCVGTTNSTYCMTSEPALSDTCISGECVEGVGCVFTNNTEPCDDGFSCTSPDVCDGMDACVGTPDDGPCQIEIPPGADPVCVNLTCNPFALGHNATSGCLLEYLSIACNDTFACTHTDICVDGVCTGTPDDGYCITNNPNPGACAISQCDPFAVGHDADGCVFVVVDEGMNCTDSYTCTENDMCTSNVTCEGVPNNSTCDAMEPALSNECIAGICSAENGTEPTGCTFFNLTGTPCDDLIPCTVDACDGMAGCAGTPDNTTCENNPGAADQCIAGVCQPGGGADSDGCIYVAQPIGYPCDDNFTCTYNDQCDGVGCVGLQNDTVCQLMAPAFGNDCVVGLCRPLMGGHDPVTGCIFANAIDGTVCEDDTYACTNDTCLAGVCQHDAIPNYCDAYFPPEVDMMCANVSCTAAPPADLVTGCLVVAYEDETPCDDGVNCTINTECFSGQCLYTVLSLDHDYCHSLLDPEEQPCQLAICTGNSSVPNGCEYSFMLYDGLPCPDNITCTDNVCDTGVCWITDVDDNCDQFAPNDCYASICDHTNITANATTGCLFEPKANGTVGCTPTPYVPCYTSTYCNGTGGCIGIPDDDYCNTVAISLDGCMTGMCTPLDVGSDSNGCTYVPVLDGESCTDGIPCTYNDTCVSGTCVGMTGPIADDYCESTPGAAGDCMTGVCDPLDLDVDILTGCVYNPTGYGTNCSDGYACTYSDFCDGIGNCIGNENATYCPDIFLDTNLCIVGMCVPGLNETDPITGCVNTSYIGDCDDGYTCTVDDACDGVSCSGTPTQGPCDALLPIDADPFCLAYTCNQTVPDFDPVTGCAATTNNTGAGCDDNVECTFFDACMADGTCAGVPMDGFCGMVVMDLGMCANVTCDPFNLTGLVTNASLGCAFVFGTPGDSCDDGFNCTTNDTCQANGICMGELHDEFCPTASQCNIARCDTNNTLGFGPPDMDGCVLEFESNATLCDDGLLCTDPDTCDGLGNCVGNANSTGDMVCDALFMSDNVCIVAMCVTTGGDANGCVYMNASSVTPCDDGYNCTGTDLCDGGGTCVGSPMDDLCPLYGAVCYNATCDPSGFGADNITGCVEVVTTGAACDDGLECTMMDVCLITAECEGTANSTYCMDIVADEPCISSMCAPTMIGLFDPITGCVDMNVTVGTDCSTGVACIDTAECDGGGVCVVTELPGVCNSTDPCYELECDPFAIDTNTTTGCVATPTPGNPNCTMDCPGGVLDACNICNGTDSCGQFDANCTESFTFALTTLAESQMKLSMCASRAPIGQACTIGLNATQSQAFYDSLVPIASLPIGSKPPSLPGIDCVDMGGYYLMSCVRDYVNNIMERHARGIDCEFGLEVAEQVGGIADTQYLHLCECVATCHANLTVDPLCAATYPFHMSGCTLGVDSMLAMVNETVHLRHITCPTFQIMLAELQFGDSMLQPLLINCSASYSDLDSIRRYPQNVPLATLVYEDTRDMKYDDDYNDFVATFVIIEAFDINGDLIGITVTIRPVARGSRYDHTLRLAFDGNSTALSNLKYNGPRTIEGPYSAISHAFGAAGAYIGDVDMIGPTSNADLTIVASSMAAMMNPIITSATDYYVNTPKFIALKEANVVYEVFVQACSPVSNNKAMRLYPGVPNYYFILNSLGHYEQTPIIHDGVTVFNGGDMLDERGYPFAFEFPFTYNWPVELRRIDVVYKKFTQLRTWFLSGGVLPHDVRFWHHYPYMLFLDEIIDSGDVPIF